MNYVATKTLTKLQTLWATRDRGSTAVEYALLVALIAAVIVAVVVTLGDKFFGSSPSK